MRIRFFWVATLWAIWLWIVVLVWVFAPATLLTLWALPVDDAGTSLGLRIAALCLGWSAILFLARREPPSGARRAISIGSAAGSAAAAAGGVYALVTGTSGAWILSAVVMELLAAAAFALAERADRDAVGLARKLGEPKVTKG